MYDYIRLNIKCPKCGEQLEKSYYASRGRCTTWWRIKCINKACEIDTGKQATMASAYEGLMVMYFGAKADCTFERELPEDNYLHGEE